MIEVEFQNLCRGDIVQHKTGDSYIIDAVHMKDGKRHYTGVQTIDISNPCEWKRIIPVARQHETIPPRDYSDEFTELVERVNTDVTVQAVLVSPDFRLWIAKNITTSVSVPDEDPPENPTLHICGVPIYTNTTIDDVTMRPLQRDPHGTGRIR